MSESDTSTQYHCAIQPKQKSFYGAYPRMWNKNTRTSVN